MIEVVVTQKTLCFGFDDVCIKRAPKRLKETSTKILSKFKSGKSVGFLCNLN